MSRIVYNCTMKTIIGVSKKNNSVWRVYFKDFDDYNGEKKINTEKNYLKAYKEVESDKIKSPELWAKAFAASEGNKVKQKSIYVELRTKQLDEM